jgi:decaprenylphospho-beta-D-erythro-pentofuranosid-2-ulose 2-reductase
MAPRDAFGRGKTVLLLGGSSDIGQAIVRRMAENGARRVILAARDPERAPDVGHGTKVDRRYFDAYDTAGHGKFFAEVFEDHQSIDTVVVAFGVLNSQEAVDQMPALGIEMAEVNYVGAASALLHVTGHLHSLGGGDVVVLSSVAGSTPRRSNFVYGSSKAAIDFLARGLASSLEGSDVHVMVVRPGFVPTAMTRGMSSRPFAASTGTVADAVVAGLARREQVVWVPGILRWVMAVVRLLPPRLLDRIES